LLPRPTVPRASQDTDLPVVQLMETRWLAKGLLQYIDADRSECGALLALFDVYEVGGRRA
jgi:hypothetical protein